MGGIFPGRPQISGTAAAPGIPNISSPTSGLFQDPTGSGVGISVSSKTQFDVYTTGFTTGFNPLPNFGVSNIAGTPFATSNNPTASSITPDGRFMYSGSGAVGTGILAFSRNLSSGVLTPLAGSPFALGGDTAGGGCVVSPDGLHLYTPGASGVLYARAINQTSGVLTVIANYAAAGYSLSPNSIAIAPDGLTVYLANANSVAAYQRNPATGALTVVPGSPFAAGVAALGVCVAADNAFVFVSNGTSNNVSVYTRVPATGVLTQVQGSPFACGALPYSIAISPDDGHVITTNATDNTLTVFALNDVNGTLTPIVGSPYATGASPRSIAFTNDSLHVVVGNFNASTISVYTRTPSSGALAAFAGSPFNTAVGGTPFGVTFSPDGSFFYLGNANQLTVNGFRTAAAATYTLIQGAFDPLGGLGGTVFINGSLNVTGAFTVNGGTPATFPAVGGNGGKALFTDGVTEVWDTNTTVVPTAFVANAATATIGDSGTYIYDLTGVLTGAATLTIAATYAGIPALVGFDNTTTGNFAITTNLGNVIPSGMSIWYWDGAALGRLAQNLVFASAGVAMVANAAAITVPANGFYSYDITGVLTGTGNITPTVNGVLTDVNITFDNQTTGGFILQFGGFLVPPGRSTWYYNGVNFELTNQNPNYIQTVTMVANAANMTLYETASNIIEVVGALTGTGQITTTFPTNSTQVIFDNGTTGAFQLQLNAGAYMIPPGKSIWYWNGTTLEVVQGATFLTTAVTPLPAAGTNNTTNHFFGALLKRVSLQLTCITAEFGYAIGDTIDNPCQAIIGTSQFNVPVWKNTTLAGFTLNTGCVLSAENRATFAMVALTAANWSYRFVLEI